MVGYPRICRNGHTIGPDDEKWARDGHGRVCRSCRLCHRVQVARQDRRLVESGKMAERVARYGRARAAERDGDDGGELEPLLAI